MPWRPRRFTRHSPGRHPDNGSAATEEDIFYCFRLILGRNPNPEEWRGHAMRVGEDLRSIVASYLSSFEFSQRDLLVPNLAAGVTVTDLEGFRIHSALDDLAVGRHVRALIYEPEVTSVFRRLLAPGMRVIDIGANIGYFTLLSASIVGTSGHVLAIEPNPRNVRLLEASRRLNGFDQVTVLQVAAGREDALLSLHTSHSNGTTSALASGVDGLLASETVPCFRVDVLVGTGERIDLIKADVEGAEFNALLGCRATLLRCRPIIVSEFSPGMMPGISGIDGMGYLIWLLDLGYDLSVINPDGTLAESTTDPTQILAVYASRGTDHIDIVCVPR